MSTYKSFEELDCWQKCREVRIWIYQFINGNSNSLDQDLIQNLIRASRSTTRNIAEGFGRFHYKDNIRFCRIALGSLFEIKEDLNICIDENRAKNVSAKDGYKLLQSSIKSVLGYINYLKSKARERQ